MEQRESYETVHGRVFARLAEQAHRSGSPSYDLMALQHEIYTDLISQGQTLEQVLAALRGLEAPQEALLAYAAEWDAAATAQRKAHAAKRVLLRAWALRAADLREDSDADEESLAQTLRFNEALEALYAALDEV